MYDLLDNDCVCYVLLEEIGDGYNTIEINVHGVWMSRRRAEAALDYLEETSDNELSVFYIEITAFEEREKDL